jgi:hypothetical protein
MYQGKEVQVRFSTAMKEIFWFVLTIIGFTWLVPINIGWFLYPLAAATAAASILLDIILGVQVILRTLVMVAVGTLILAMFYLIKLTFVSWAM